MSTKRDSEAPKGCKCKKSRCLKLYCDCFSSGYYCSEACGCKGCYNLPDYEDTVEEAREEIEKKDPFAFSSKIHHAPKIGDQLMPTAGKHRKGCNCKKSMCFRNYCECYEAKVPCSDGCRCEGCKNVYGKKGENPTNCIKEHNVSEPFDSMRTIVDNNSSPQLLHLQNITDQTPFPDPDEGYFTSTTGRMDPFDQEAHHPNLEFLNPFTPDEINASQLTSMTNLPPMMPLDQESNPNVLEFLNPFTPQDINESQLTSMADLHQITPLDQQSYHNVGFMNQFAPQDMNASQLTSMTNHPQMMPFDQQSYPDLEFMNQFTPQDMNESQLTSVTNLPQMMPLDQQFYPDAQIMNQFTPQGINASLDTSMADLRDMMSMDQQSYRDLEFMNQFTQLDHINGRQSTLGTNNLPPGMDWEPNEMLMCSIQGNTLNNIPSESSRCSGSGRSNVSSPDDK